ncbi:DUF1302 domain-containing protein [Arenimonas donghaensis]|uniref:DUF1302 domain-containing protein n=1 Tax=Arenimonas donghaensis DSM 18148 = HO3-R19 TaxID=1121014 RepID=A0A087MJA8_9GAMM|nr:DUF1302 domain-containing protein [Arenimonas donghaensis]KFL36961.1 hypothetical protein N788_11990 [Arenimonas donghaensis DSM 18148 = HO3-R19]
MKKLHANRGRVARARLATAVALGLMLAPAAQAIEFSRGDLQGSFDTTVSYGYSWRVEDQDPNLIGKSWFDPLLCTQNVPLGPIPVGPGRCTSTGGVPGSPAQVAAMGRFSANRDDGNLKYDEGDAISSAIKLTSELSLNYRDWGMFMRATYFHDFENEGRDDLTEEAQDRIGQRFRMLDAFVFKNFALADDGSLAGTVRLGRQVVSWGESTFIQNGINVINPVDLSALRVAGAELREAFLPIDMLYGSISLSDNVSLEALYMFEFEEIEIDAAGTYFSSNDFASPGGTYVMLGFGTTPQPVYNPERFFSTCYNGPAGYATSDRFGDLSAIYGAATAAQIIAIGCGNAVGRLPNRNARDDGQYGMALRWYAEALGETEFGFYFLNYHSRVPLLSGRAVNNPAIGAASGRFFAEFPEDIQMYGFSWNTTIPGGIAWQGEVSHRPNMPLQVDDVELLFAALSPLNPFIPVPALQFNSQLGNYALGQEVRGWREHEVSQVQMTFTKLFADVMGANQIAVVGEVGGTEVWDLPSHSVLRYEGEGTDTGGGCDVGDVLAAGFPGAGALQFGCMRNPQSLGGGFPTAFSWGYRVAARADYNGAFGTALTLSPRIAFNHDVSGITPGPGGNFLEDRKSLTLGLEANYLQQWVFDLSYTSFSGAEPYNQISDRDFAAFTVKYSF